MHTRPVTLTPAWTCALDGDIYHELRATTIDGRAVVPVSVDGVQRLDLYDPARGPDPVAQLSGAPAEVQSLCAIRAGAARKLVATATKAPIGFGSHNRRVNTNCVCLVRSLAQWRREHDDGRRPDKGAPATLNVGATAAA